MPTPNDFYLRRTAALGLIDEATGLPAWATGDNENVRAAGIATLDLFEALEKLEVAVARIQGDGELTGAGKAARIATAARTFVTIDIGLAEGKLQGLERTLRHARGALAIPRPEGDQLIAELRAQEIRRNLAGANGIKITEVALVAAQAGDLETLNAILRAPGEPIIDEAGRKHVAEAFFAGSAADEVARVERLESGHRQLSGQIKSARSRALQLGAEHPDTLTTA